MLATLLWCQRTFTSSPEQQLLAVLGGTGLRLVVVLAGGIALYHQVEALNRPAFLIWVVVFYLATLTLEIMLVAQRLTQPSSRPTSRPPQRQP